MDSDDDEVATRYQQLDFGPADDSVITEIEVAPESDPSPSDFVWGYSSFVEDPSLVAKYRPTGFEMYPDEETTLIQVKVAGKKGWSHIALDVETYTVVAQSEPCRTEGKSWERLQQILKAKGYTA